MSDFLHMRAMKISSSISLVMLVGNVELSQAPSTLSHLLPFSQKLRTGSVSYLRIFPLFLMSSTPVMNWIGFRRVIFLSLSSPQLHVQLINSAFGRVLPYHSDP